MDIISYKLLNLRLEWTEVWHMQQELTRGQTVNRHPITVKTGRELYIQTTHRLGFTGNSQCGFKQQFLSLKYSSIILENRKIGKAKAKYAILTRKR